jgi:CO dehydrogenase maturation factor
MRVVVLYLYMAYVIGFAGKGGTGKTSIAALTVRYLIERRRGPVLAVDADSNSCLNEALGVEIHATIGRLREESLATVRSGESRPGGMSMEQLFDYQVQQSIIEFKGFDLMVMGSESYPYVVIDNEAGMEHLSRRTTHKVNLLLIISDPTARGVLTAKRINGLVDELELDVENKMLIINRVTGTEGAMLRVQAEGYGIQVAGAVPQDRMISEYDLKGLPLFSLPPDSDALTVIYHILDSLGIP